MRNYLARLQAELRRYSSAQAMTDNGLWLFWLALALLVAATVIVWSSGYQAGFHTLNSLCSSSRHPALWQTVTYLCDTLPAVLVLLPFARKYPQLLWLGLIAAAIASLGVHTIKPLFDSYRPAAVLAPGSFELVGPVYKRASFPSGHATTAFVTAGVFAYFSRSTWKRTVLLCVAGIASLGRVAVGAHWPVDVAAGAALGLASVAVAVPIAKHWRGGLHFLPYHLFVLALGAGAVGAFFMEIPYPAAKPVLWLIAAVGLTALTDQFVLQPLQLRGSERR